MIILSHLLHLLDCSNAEEKVARPINFWKELENECKRNNEQLCTLVGEIMATWTEQAGFPVVSVTIDNGKVFLEQQRFLLRNLKSTPINQTWWLPITWTTQRNPNFNQVNVSWINGQRDSSINIDKSAGWVIFNVQSAGENRLLELYTIVQIYNKFIIFKIFKVINI